MVNKYKVALLISCCTRRGESDKMESDAIAYRNNWNIVDASRDIDAVTSEVIPPIIQSVLS